MTFKLSNRRLCGGGLFSVSSPSNLLWRHIHDWRNMRVFAPLQDGNGSSLIQCPNYVEKPKCYCRRSLTFTRCQLTVCFGFSAPLAGKFVTAVNVASSFLTRVSIWPEVPSSNARPGWSWSWWPECCIWIPVLAVSTVGKKGNSRYHSSNSSRLVKNVVCHLLRYLIHFGLPRSWRISLGGCCWFFRSDKENGQLLKILKSESWFSTISISSSLRDRFNRSCDVFEGVISDSGNLVSWIKTIDL